MNKCFFFSCKKFVFLLNHHNQALTAGQKNCLTEIVTVSYYKTTEKNEVSEYSNIETELSALFLRS